MARFTDVVNVYGPPQRNTSTRKLTVCYYKIPYVYMWREENEFRVYNRFQCLIVLRVDFHFINVFTSMCLNRECTVCILIYI